MKKLILLLAVVLALYIFKMITMFPQPVESDYFDGVLSSESDPLQEKTDTGSFYIRIKNGTMELTPRAAYSITARVAHKKRYRTGWNAGIAPYDLALSWGQLNHKDVMPHIKYSQSGRWYYFKFDALCPVSGSYISGHSANSHIIHGSENLCNLLKRVKKGDYLRLEGYLVNADGFIKGGKVTWYSSISRNDTGSGACEVFYVKRIWYDGKIYK